MSYVFKGVWQDEGAGARVCRIIGSQYLKNLDPFLLLDFAKVKLPAGFPDHPHRGFETVSYMKKGKFYHEDFKGHKGQIGPGDVQWMTAGRGIVHSQIPYSSQQETMGFQLWLNLRSKDKMQEPKYQQIKKEQIPVFEKDGMNVKIICGKWQGHQGPIKYNTPAYYMDIQALKNGSFQIPIQKNWNSIIFNYQGQLQYCCGQAKHEVKELQCCVLEKSTQIDLVHRFNVKTGGKFLLIAGQPINQPLARYGPFVMNTQGQIEQAFQDYQECKNGFENRKYWESKIKQIMKGKKYEELGL